MASMLHGGPVSAHVAELSAAVARMWDRPWPSRVERFWREVAVACEAQRDFGLRLCAQWAEPLRRDPAGAGVDPDAISLRPGERWIMPEVASVECVGPSRAAMRAEHGYAPCPASGPHDDCVLCRGAGRIEAL